MMAMDKEWKALLLISDAPSCIRPFYLTNSAHFHLAAATSLTSSLSFFPSLRLFQLLPLFLSFLLGQSFSSFLQSCKSNYRQREGGSVEGTTGTFSVRRD